MSLHDIAEDIGETTEEQHDDHDDRFADGDLGDELHERSMDDYDGGWDVDH